MPGSVPAILFSDERLRKARAGVGSVNFSIGSDTAFRRLPYEIEGLRTFAVVVAEKALGRPVGREGFGGGGAWIDYHGPPGTVVTTPFSELLDRTTPAAAAHRLAELLARYFRSKPPFV